jgi:putative hemolysin
MSAGLLVLIGFVLLLLIASSALFSAVETALFSLQAVQIERLKARRADFATALARLMENPRRLLSVILLMDTLANLPLIILCLFLLHTTVSPRVPFWAAGLLIFGLVVFVCDLVPKLFALSDAERISKFGVLLLQAVMPALEPVTRVLERVSMWIADALTPSRMLPHQFLSEEELETLVEWSAEEGALHETESEMIQEIIKLGDKDGEGLHDSAGRYVRPS